MTWVPMTVHQNEPHWAPLEDLAAVIGSVDGVRLEPDEFMWMGRVDRPQCSPIELYKHHDTRLYLNIDGAGHTYRFQQGRYEAWHSPIPAIAHAIGTRRVYQCWTNVDAHFARPYEPGDRLVRGWADAITIPQRADTEVYPLAERVWMRHNADDRPDGQLCPSMSIGDVVMFGQLALSADRHGFVRVDLDPHDLIVDRKWSQVVDEPQPTRVSQTRQTSAQSILAAWGSTASQRAPQPKRPELGLGP